MFIASLGEISIIALSSGLCNMGALLSSYLSHCALIVGLLLLFHLGKQEECLVLLDSCPDAHHIGPGKGIGRLAHRPD